MTGQRFEVLDSWRGICAIGVTLLHGIIVSHVFGAPIIGNAWLFVDFFFVLSGFVISYAYFDKLTSMQSIQTFIIRRFGRLWPLHVAMLAILVIWESAIATSVLILHLPVLPSDIFHDPWLTASSILANIALIHAIGLGNLFTNIYAWNGPSWSISVEFYTCLIFALISVYGGRYASWWAAAAALVSVAVLAASDWGALPSGDYAIFRGIYGFIAGHFVWRAAKLRSLPARFATIAEIAIVAGIIAYMALANTGPIALLAPLFFGPAVWIFSAGRGAVSRLLGNPPFLKLGALSYSIYMTHYVILRIGLTSAKAADHFLHTGIVTDYYVPGIGTAQFFNFGSRWLGDAFEILYVAIVISVSILTFRFIEMPARDFFNKKANALSRTSTSAAMASGPGAL